VIKSTISTKHTLSERRGHPDICESRHFTHMWNTDMTALFRAVMSVTISTWKQCSVRLYLQLFVVGLISYLCYLCLLAHSGVQHILCCVFDLFFLRLVYPMLPVSQDCQFLVAPSIFFYVYSLRGYGVRPLSSLSKCLYSRPREWAHVGCMCVRDINLISLSTIFWIDLVLVWRCGIICLSLYPLTLFTSLIIYITPLRFGDL
jgi:hypothetical protein